MRVESTALGCRIKGGSYTKEEKLYPIVLNYLKKHDYITEGIMEKGTRAFDFTRVGGKTQADVVGVKDVGRDYSNEIEIAAVEVKKGTRAKVRYIQQALGYSAFAHKCYLAMPTKFTEEDKNYARRMGVGLLEIHDTQIKEVLSADSKKPDETIMLWFLRRSLFLVKCMVCGSFIHRHEEKERRPTYTGIENAFGNIKTLYICPDCRRLFKLPQPRGG